MDHPKITVGGRPDEPCMACRGGEGHNQVERCPQHQEPIGDGRSCSGCDGGVF